MPEASAYPTAAGVPDSGTGMTRSASAGCSLASRRPISTRVACTPRPPIVGSGRAPEAAAGRGVGAGQVDVLEHAALGLGMGEVLAAQAVLVDGDQLAGLHLADD